MRVSRHINHTGRRKIKRSEVQISFHEPVGRPPHFDIAFSLDTANMPPDARLYVEAYHHNTTQRFDFGSVRSPVPPVSTELNELDLTGPVLFRIKVVDWSDRLGRLVASADRLRPESDDEEENRASLMTFKSTDLGEQTWKMEFNQERKPVLCINNRIPEAKSQLMNNPMLQSLILPSALRETLLFILMNNPEEPDEESWHKPWVDFANLIAPVDKPETGEPYELHQWIDDVVNEFCQQHDMCSMFIKRLEESGG